jgi:hypothetical protein
MLRILSAAIAVSGFASAVGAAEETHRFVPLSGAYVGTMSFLDTAATRTDGDEVEIAVLDVRFDYKGPGPSRVIVGDIRRYRVSCVWRATRGPTSTTFYDEAGAFLLTRPAETALHMSFYGKLASYAPAIDQVCGWAPAEATPSFTTVKEALAFAATTMMPPEPSPVSLPPPSPSARKKGEAPKVMMAVPVTQERKLVLPEFPEIAPHRFSVIARDEGKGHTQFLDWANMRREGEAVVALTLTVLGDESAAPPAPQWRWPVLALRSTRFDCKAQTVEVLGEAFGYKDLSLNPQPRSGLPARLAASSPVASAALKTACGAEPRTTYAGVADAFAFARAQR